MDIDKEWVEYLSKRMRDAVMSRIPEVTLNGDPEKRYPGNLNFSFAYVEVRSASVDRKSQEPSVRFCIFHHIRINSSVISIFVC